MSRDYHPCAVDADGEYTLLERLELTDKLTLESFLQETLHARPEIIPVDSIDSSYGPLISLGREIDNIDNLFISPDGRLTLVETKLWRNPQAVREVVAQILDYATRLSQWSYEQLQERARKAASPAAGSDWTLHGFVQKHDIPEHLALSEADFIDEVQTSLSNGRFLLLIVGDGIRENLESMMESLHTHPQKQFTFGLLELQLFQDPAVPGRTLILPHLLVKTNEITRGIIRVITSGEAEVSVNIEEKPISEQSKTKRTTLTEEEFYEAIEDSATQDTFRHVIEHLSELGATAEWRSKGVSIRLLDPGGSKIFFTLCILTVYGEVYTGWIGKQLERAGKNRNIATQLVQELCELFPYISPRPNYDDAIQPHINGTDVAVKLDDFCDLFRTTIDRITAS